MKLVGRCVLALCAASAVTILADLAQADSEPSSLPLTPKPDEAVLYIYRDSFVSDWFFNAAMYVNGVKVCDLRRKQYSCVALRPGDYVVNVQTTISKGGEQIDINNKYNQTAAPGHLSLAAPLVAGKMYFVAYQVRANPLTNTNSWELKLVAGTKAIEDLQKCSYVSPLVDKSQIRLVKFVPPEPEPPRKSLRTRVRHLLGRDDDSPTPDSDPASATATPGSM